MEKIKRLRAILFVCISIFIFTKRKTMRRFPDYMCVVFGENYGYVMGFFISIFLLVLRGT